MSQISMERILGKAMLDEEFRIALFMSPDETLAKFQLTLPEKVRIKRLDNETLEFLAKTLNACPGWGGQVVHNPYRTHKSNNAHTKNKENNQ